MIGFTLPEIRRLLIKLVLRVNDSTKPDSATTNDADTHSPECRCSI